MIEDVEFEIGILVYLELDANFWDVKSVRDLIKDNSWRSAVRINESFIFSWPNWMKEEPVNMQSFRKNNETPTNKQSQSIELWSKESWGEVLYWIVQIGDTYQNFSTNNGNVKKCEQMSHSIAELWSPVN